MKKYKVSIYTLGKIFLIHNKPVRTPFETIINNEKDLKNIKLKIKLEAIDNYTIEELEEVEHKIEPINFNNASNLIKKIKNKKNIKITEEAKKEESTSLLSKYSRGEL